MARFYFQSQQRFFQHKGYSVLIKEWYNPWADSPGYPSLFWVLYVDKSKEMILHMIEGISMEQMEEMGAKFDNVLKKYDIKFIVIENKKGFFSLPKTIDWAVTEAKERI